MMNFLSKKKEISAMISLFEFFVAALLKKKYKKSLISMGAHYKW
jgi:hypothetical protein